MMKFGLVGCGGIGELRAQAIPQAGAHQLVAVQDLDGERANRLAKQCGAAVHENWLELVGREDIDAVIVATPPSSHAEISMAALEAGKHVLVEKPVTRTADEARRLVAAAGANGRFLATGYNYRFYPSFIMARRLLAEGRIGALDHIRSYTGYTANDHHSAWLHEEQVMGGGSLRDNGTHLIDLTLYFLGGAQEYTGYASNHVWQFPGCEDNGFLLIRNPAGVIATLQASWTEWRGYRFGLEIYGERGIIRATCFPMGVEVTWKEPGESKFCTKADRFWMTFVMEHWKSYRWVVVQSFIEEFKEFVKGAQGLPTEIATGMDGLRAIEAALAAEGNSRL
jgi:predicted dehydrogenase